VEARSLATKDGPARMTPPLLKREQGPGPLELGHLCHLARHEIVGRTLQPPETAGQLSSGMPGPPLWLGVPHRVHATRMRFRALCPPSEKAPLTAPNKNPVPGGGLVPVCPVSGGALEKLVR